MRLRSDDNDVMLPGDKIVVSFCQGHSVYVWIVEDQSLYYPWFIREISPIKNKWSVRHEERA